MDRNCLAIVAAAILLCCSCGSGAGHRPGVPAEIVTDENTEADLGLVYESDGLAKTVLVVRNASYDTLMPVGAYSRCRCAEASVDAVPVAPGEDIRVSVVYNPAYRKGVFMEEVQVKFLGTKRIMSLIVKGEVVPCEHPVSDDYPYDYGSGLHMSHETLHFGNLKAGESRMIYIRYANESGVPAGLSFEVQGEIPGRLSFRPSVSIGAGARDTLHFRFTMPGGIAPSDTLRFSLQPCINGKPLGKKLNVKAISPAA